MNEPLIFPVRLPAHAMFLARPALALAFDLPSTEEAIWLPMVADGKHERKQDDVIGYLQLKRSVTLQPGLTTYAVVAMRPAHDPPPSPATFRTVFQWPSLEVCVALMRSGSALHD